MADLSTTTGTGVQLDRAIEAAKAQALEQFAQATVEEIMLKAAEKRLAVLEARRKLVLRTFEASDVNRLGDKLAKNKFAAEKLHEIFGGSFELLKDPAGKPICDVQALPNDPDVGEVRIYTYYGRYVRPDGKAIEQAGSFSTKDAFFAKDTNREGSPWKSIDEIDVVSVMVAAQTEAYKKCIFRGAALGYWTDDEAEVLAQKAAGHDFGAAGGSGAKAVTVGFGKSKGKTPGELADADLEWTIKAYTENVADPKKARYKAENQRVLDALTAERDRRRTGTAPAPAAAPTAPASAAPADGQPQEGAGGGEGEPTSRGRKVGDLHVRLLDTAKGNMRTVAGMLRLYTKERGAERSAISQLTDPELDALLALDDSALAGLRARAEGGT
jgi:hypothetical protein